MAIEYTQGDSEIIADFSETLSFVKTGRNFNITRQRAEQIVKKHKESYSAAALERYVNKKNYVGQFCPTCGRQLKKYRVAHGLCRACSDYERKEEKGLTTGRLRLHERPVVCGVCQRSFSKQHNKTNSRVGLICRRCYYHLRTMKAIRAQKMVQV